MGLSAAAGGGAARPTFPGSSTPERQVLANDDFNHRVIVIDPATDQVVWQYGHTGVAGSTPGYLNDPDGVDLPPPYALTAAHLSTVGVLDGGGAVPGGLWGPGAAGSRCAARGRLAPQEPVPAGTRVPSGVGQESLEIASHRAHSGRKVVSGSPLRSRSPHADGATCSRVAPILRAPPHPQGGIG